MHVSFMIKRENKKNKYVYFDNNANLPKTSQLPVILYSLDVENLINSIEDTNLRKLSRDVNYIPAKLYSLCELSSAKTSCDFELELMNIDLEQNNKVLGSRKWRIKIDKINDDDGVLPTIVVEEI